MQRRHNPPVPSTPVRNGSGSGKYSSSTRGAASSNPLNPVRPPPSNSNHGLSSWVLILVAVALTVANFMYPEVQQYEHEMMQGAIDAEAIIEKEMMEWWQSSNGQNKPPIAEHEHEHRKTSERAASERMAQQDSKWVDGEKRLKQELKKLVALQEQGKELGVPVLTRWVGDDIPAWAGEGVDREEWEKKVKARYDVMREEENRWREMVAATIESEKRG